MGLKGKKSTENENNFHDFVISVSKKIGAYVTRDGTPWEEKMGGR